MGTTHQERGEGQRRDARDADRPAQPEAHQPAQPQQEHRWLERMVGEWTYEGEAITKPGSPPERSSGVETVRSLGGLWIVAEGRGEMPGGGAATTILTLGYDPKKGHYVGTWIGSMMTNLWVYQGTLDREGTTLRLDTEGPDMSDPEGKLAKYRETITWEGDDHRVFTSHALGPDGQWHAFMTAHYHRKSGRS